MVKKIVKAFNLSWLLDVDVMSKKDGTPVVLEINSRASGSCAAAIKAGIPLYEQLLDLSQGKEVREITIEKDIEILKYNALLKVEN